MTGWWSRRTLHARLSLLVTGAVAAAVVTLAVMAWLAVAEIQQHQIRSDLNATADAIAAQPDQWLSAPDGPEGGDRHRPHQIGPRWQILNADAAVITDSPTSLP